MRSCSERLHEEALSEEHTKAIACQRVYQEAGAEEQSKALECQRQELQALSTVTALEEQVRETQGQLDGSVLQLQETQRLLQQMQGQPCAADAVGDGSVLQVQEMRRQLQEMRRQLQETQRQLQETQGQLCAANTVAEETRASLGGAAAQLGNEVEMLKTAATELSAYHDALQQEIQTVSSGEAADTLEVHVCCPNTQSTALQQAETLTHAHTHTHTHTHTNARYSRS